MEESHREGRAAVGASHLSVCGSGLSSLGVREDVLKELSVLMFGCAVSSSWCAASLAVARGL